MRSLHAIFEKGVFRPVEHVDLPENTQVLIDIRSADDRPVGPDGDWDDVYEILSRSYPTGESDLAARHDEHQP